MRSLFFGARWPLLAAVACALAGANAGAQCTNLAFTSQPSSQVLTDGTEVTTITLSASASPTPNSYQYRKGGAGFGDFGPWTLTSSGSGSGGWFTGASGGNGSGGTNNDIGYAWGLWANGGELVNATRLFSPTNSVGNNEPAYGTPEYNATPVLPLPVGVTFGVDMDNGYISSSESVGIGLQNAAGQNLWEWYFSGGASDYSYHDNAGYNSSTLGWSQDGMHIAFTLTSSNTYSATVTLTDGGSVTVSGTLISQSDNRIVQLRAFNSSAGSGSAYDFFVNNLSILDKTDNAYTPTYLSPRSWVNGDGSGWDLHNGSNSGFFLGSSAGNGGGIDGGDEPFYPEVNQSGCWGIFANSGDVADALRPFGQPLYIGDSVVLLMDNGYVDSNSSVGFGLQSGATNRFEFFFKGGNTDYSINDSTANRDSGVAWSDQGLGIMFTLTGTNTYSLVVQTDPDNGPPTSGVTVTGTLEGVSGTLIDRIRLFNASGGSNSTHNLYFSTLQVGSTNATFLCSPNYDCSAALKFDNSGFEPSSVGWQSGQDNGYSVFGLTDFNGEDGSPPIISGQGDIFYGGNHDLQGCYDVIANSSCGDSNGPPAESTPWYIQVVAPY